MKKHEKYYIQEFILNFVKKKNQEEWLNCALSPDIDMLSRLSAWDFWDDSKTDQSACSEWSNNIYKLQNSPFIREYLNRICVTIKLGHDQAGVEARMLSEIINSEIYVLEGVVIVDPEKLALVFNHDGGIVICSKTLSIEGQSR